MPEDVVVSESAFYKVKPRTPVALSVTIGDSQSGGTDVTLNGDPIGNGVIKDLHIGTADEDLKKKSIECITTVKRVNPASSRTSVTYQLRKGVEDRDYTYEATVTQMGERAIYEVSFIFS